MTPAPKKKTATTAPPPKPVYEKTRKPRVRLTDSKTELWRERCHADMDVPPGTVHGAIPISAVIAGVLSDMHLDQHDLLITIQRSWEQIAGSDLARNLAPHHYKNGTLTLKVAHPSFKMELQGSPMLAEIRTRLKALPGCQTLRAIRLVV